MQRQTKLKHKLHSKAFALRLAGDSQGVRTYTKDAKAFTDVEALVSLELLIHELATSGDRQGLRDALYLYLRLTVRGVEW